MDYRQKVNNQNHQLFILFPIQRKCSQVELFRHDVEIISHITKTKFLIIFKKIAAIAVYVDLPEASILC